MREGKEYILGDEKGKKIVEKTGDEGITTSDGTMVQNNNELTMGN